MPRVLVGAAVQERSSVFFHLRGLGLSFREALPNPATDVT
jgi:hypothetical protein